MLHALLGAAVLAGCSFHGAMFGDAATGDDIDAGDDTDAPPNIDAPPPGPHLLLTEVRSLFTDEFIEIYNPDDVAVALDTYYLTDYQHYERLPAHEAGSLQINTGVSDFIVKFPAGASIAPHAVAVIALNGEVFKSSFLMNPTYTVVVPTTGAIAMEPTNPSTTGNMASVTNDGELIVLFRWDGSSDRVVDVDIVIAGNAPSPTNDLVDKTDVDGPDPDTAVTPYEDDDGSLEDMATDIVTDLNGRQSYKRIGPEAGEITTGGNGVGGHDETSEAIRTSWDSAATPVLYSLATPGTVPAGF